MKPEPSKELDDYTLALSLIETNLKYLESLKYDPAALYSYRKVVSHLKSRSEEEIKIIINHSSKSNKKAATETRIGFTNLELDALTVVQIKKMLGDPDVTRVLLERVAAVRFGVTKGALSQLRSIASLKEKIETLLAHEGTHAAISKVAAGSIESKDKEIN